MWQLRRHTAREESVSYNLGRLTSCYVVARPEVGPVLRSNARFAWSSALIALHHVTRSKALYELVESMIRRHVLEGLSNRRLCEPGSI